jgi:hypothetical protein
MNNEVIKDIINKFLILIICLFDNNKPIGNDNILKLTKYHESYYSVDKLFIKIFI